MRVFTILLLSIILLSTCRKGEDDPILSLKSRESRLTGNWKLTSLLGSHDLINDNSIYDFYQALYIPGQEMEYQLTRTCDGYRIILYYEEYNCWMNIKKDGTMETIYRTKGTSYFNDDVFGSWNWVEGEGKRKENVDLGAFHPNAQGFNYRIRKLKNRELTLVLSIDDYYFNDEGEITQIIGEYIYEFEKIED